MPVAHFLRPLARKCLHESIDNVQLERPFDLTAVVLLPDHLHSIWYFLPMTIITQRGGA